MYYNHPFSTHQFYGVTFPRVIA